MPMEEAMKTNRLRDEMINEILEIERTKPERISPALADVIEQASWAACEFVLEQEHRRSVLFG